MTAASDLAELHEHVTRRLAEAGQRYTSGRRRLVEVLAGLEHPATLPNLIASAPGMAQSSAYRSLDVFERCGVVRRINGTGDRAHFELAEDLLGHHHHLICLRCGSVEDMHLADDLERRVERHLDAVAVAAGFAAEHHSLDLHGHCRDCLDRSE